MKRIEMKYKGGGYSVVTNVVDEYHARGFSYYMVMDTDRAVSTVYKLDSDGYYVGEKNTQAYKIRDMIPKHAGQCECGAKSAARCADGPCNMHPEPPDEKFPSAQTRWYLGY